MPGTPEDGPFDVLVYGATTGGVIAAITAASAGSRVILVDPGKHVGGMVAGGLGWTDRWEEPVIGGLAAASAATHGVAVHQIAITELQRRLVDQGQVLARARIGGGRT